MEQNNYYVGIDMGTNSVGWAVTDQEYNLLRAKQKDMWGIREFDEALTAVERRSHRTSRRRTQRSAVRIGLIKEYFSKEIAKVDPGFLQRLENSKYYLEDKDEVVRAKYSIFNDNNYKDNDYYNDYPTIFHLRQKLINSNEKQDVRLVYLAVSNMFKHRGHFLNSGLSTEVEEKSINLMLIDLENTIADMLEMSMSFSNDIDKLEEIISSRDYSRTSKAETIMKLLNISNSEKSKKTIIKALCGLNVKVIDLFKDLEEVISDEDKALSFSFTDTDYDEKSMILEEKLGEDNYIIVEKMKTVFDKALLANIMKGYNYLSDARVAEYDKHATDLKLLKQVVKKYFSQKEYDSFFRSKEGGTYSAYVNTNNTGVKNRRDYKDRKREDLYKTIKKMLTSLEIEDEDVSYILNEINKETFLPKQLTSSNGVIPNQAHARELHKVLDNASKYLGFLNEKDESGLTVANRIERLFSFQIPYYVGPVSSKSNGWVVRKEEGQVLPWNIEEKVDLKQTSEEFIKRMVRTCTYISDEIVLPKNSLLYERYRVLNEINNIKINDERINVQLKQNIYNDLFLTGKRVTRNMIFKYLHNRGIVNEDIEISGIDIAINNSLSTYSRFLPILGDEIKTDAGKDMVEKIVFWCTIYGDSKKFLKDKIEENYSNVLDTEQIKRLVGIKFKDWGRLSKEFLELQGCNKVTGEVMSLINALWDTNLNLMELINSESFTFKDELEKKKNKSLKVLSEYTVEDLNEEYFSAPVKRMIWQTMSIIKEVEKIMGKAPEKIFLEMTRSDEEKGQAGRKTSRKNQLLELYKQIKSESSTWKNEMTSKIEKLDDDGSLRSKKLYLYFIQKGLDMYTGAPIDLDNLMSANSNYDIDHIYPRHFVKDDNLNNNLVLASKPANAEKSDIYPIKESIYSKMKNIWLMLKEEKLITEEKYKRLVGRNPFTEEQKAGFIARQLVETSQGAKGVADLIKQLLPETTIVYSKASNVSEFRHKYNIAKCRLLNDFHHANDAYLNIVVGNVYYTKFTQNPINFIQKEYATGDKRFEYNLSRMFDWNVSRNDKCAWTAEKDGIPGSIAVVKKTISKNTPILTRLSFEGHGGISKATIYSHNVAKKDGYLPLKATDGKLQDVTKYGGYTSASTAYFILVEHELKGKIVRTIETVPVYMKDSINKSDGALLEYCINQLGLINPSIRIKKIKIQSLLRINGYNVHLSGKTLDRIGIRNAIPMCLPGKWVEYVHKLEKHSEKGTIDRAITQELNSELYYEIINKHKNTIFIKKVNYMGDKLEKCKERFDKLSLEKQITTLLEILKLTMIGITCGNLTEIGESTSSGKMLISKNISNLEECKLINQSVTGIYENSIDLLTV